MTVSAGNLHPVHHAARRLSHWLMLSLPLSAALIYSQVFLPSFAAPKNAILVLTSVAMAALVLVSPMWQLDRDELRFFIAASAYLAFTILSALMSPLRAMCLQSVTFSTCGLLVFVGARFALAGKDKTLGVRRLQTAIGVAADLVALATVLQFFSLDPPAASGIVSHSAGRMRMYATLGNPDFVSAFLAVAMPAVLSFAVTVQRFRALWISSCFLIGAAILLTGSRAGFIAMAAGVSVVALFNMNIRASTMFGFALAAASVLACGTQLNARSVSESLGGRLFIWRVSLSDGAAQSAWGSGPGTFAYLYPADLGRFFALSGREPLLHFAGNESHAQNDFVEALREDGWLGLGSLLALLGFWLAAAIPRLRRSDPQSRPAILAAIASVSALCAASLFDFPMHRAETWVLLWLCLAVPFTSSIQAHALAPHYTRSRYAAAAVLLIVGGYSAIAPLAGSFKLAKGEVEEAHGRLESSEAAYRAALRFQPWSPDANFNLARALAKSGNSAAALAQLKNASLYVNEPELYILRSRTLENSGRTSEALRELDLAARLFPYSSNVRDEISSYRPTGESSEMSPVP